MIARRPRHTFGTHAGRPVGLSYQVDRLPMPSWRSIHAVAPVTFDDGSVWGCLADCPFVGDREDAIGHAVRNQFDMATP